MIVLKCHSFLTPFPFAFAHWPLIRQPAPHGRGLTADTSQILTTPSRLAEASLLPSGLNATHATALVGSLKVATSWPVAASQTLTVWSLLPEASSFPSGLKTTDSGVLAWPFTA